MSDSLVNLGWRNETTMKETECRKDDFRCGSFVLELC